MQGIRDSYLTLCPLHQAYGIMAADLLLLVGAGAGYQQGGAAPYQPPSQPNGTLPASAPNSHAYSQPLTANAAPMQQAYQPGFQYQPAAAPALQQAAQQQQQQQQQQLQVQPQVGFSVPNRSVAVRPQARKKARFGSASGIAAPAYTAVGPAGAVLLARAHKNAMCASFWAQLLCLIHIGLALHANAGIKWRCCACFTCSFCVS